MTYPMIDGKIVDNEYQVKWKRRMILIKICILLSYSSGRKNDE
jgi:hypothetical protein